MRKAKNNLCLIVFSVIIISIIYVLPIFHGGILEGDDVVYHITRFKSLCSQFKLGNFHPLIYPEMLKEQGYASGIFYPDYFFYPFAFLNLLGVKISLCFELYYIIVNILTGLSFFFCSRAIFKDYDRVNCNFKAFVVFLLSIIDFYKLRNYYGRAALGEFTAMIFAPIVVLGIYYILKYGKKSYVLAFGMTGVLMCHILSFIMACMVLFIVCIYNFKQIIKTPGKLTMIISAALQCGLISCFIWLPMLEMLIKCDLTISHGAALFLKPIWKTYALKLGGYKTVGTLGLIAVLIYSILKNSPGHRIIQLMSFSLIFISDCFPWKLFGWCKPLTAIQFPWRFMSVFYFGVLFYLFLFVKSHSSKNISDYVKKMLFVVFTVFYILLLSSSSLFGAEPWNKTIIADEEISKIDDVGFLEYAPYELSVFKKSKAHLDENNCYVLSELMSISPDITGINGRKHIYIEKEVIKSGYRVKYTTEDNEIIIPIINYPGYTATLNNTKIKSIESDKYEFMKFRDIPNEGNIFIIYEGTVLQHISLTISFFATVISLLLVLAQRKKTRLSV